MEPNTTYILLLSTKHWELAGLRWFPLTRSPLSRRLPNVEELYPRTSQVALTDDRELEVLNISSWHYVSIAGFITLPLALSRAAWSKPLPEATA
ncbi:hypothetical protein EVAR_100603_1 [Eumeta japonica]|uniref:Uncharacterized protein n=1 Tax=Eumeta variegata TaxID=151549 RepID=A0A4C2A6I2_EUMVA|nr:hypothetical protein EVAR_100603_1 [Eumeta japonica]